MGADGAAPGDGDDWAACGCASGGGAEARACTHRDTANANPASPIVTARTPGKDPGDLYLILTPVRGVPAVSKGHLQGSARVRPPAGAVKGRYTPERTDSSRSRFCSFAGSTMCLMRAATAASSNSWTQVIADPASCAATVTVST